jgi:hypothetical protein
MNPHPARASGLVFVMAITALPISWGDSQRGASAQVPVRPAPKDEQ